MIVFSLMGNTLFKLLENPELIKASGRDLLSSIFENIGVLVRYFGRAKCMFGLIHCSMEPEFFHVSVLSAVSAKLIGLLQQCEYLSLPATTSSPFAEGVADIVQREGSDVLIIELMT
jgi:hypothetical protein